MEVLREAEVSRQKLKLVASYVRTSDRPRKMEKWMKGKERPQ